METDMFYRVGYGLSSKLLQYKNGVFYLQVVLGRRWNRTYNATAHELANCWKDTHLELHRAVGCKVFIIDAKKYQYKQTLINSGINPGYDAKKGVLFVENYLN